MLDKPIQQNLRNQNNLLQLGRPTCYVCRRPKTHCFCSFAKPFEAHCKIVVLQHPHELRKYYGTIKLMKQLLLNLSIYRGIEFANNVELQNELLRPTYLLYPSADALDASEVILDTQTNLMVIDGTWREARKILHVNPWLQKLPKVTFKSQQYESQYRIRKQPAGKVGFLSSLEACTYFLQSNFNAGLEKGFASSAKPAPPYSLLFDVFDKMITQQVRCMEQPY